MCRPDFPSKCLKIPQKVNVSANLAHVCVRMLFAAVSDYTYQKPA
jgi:hypothetical protein